MKKTILLGILAVMLIMPLAHADITTGLQGYWKFNNNLRDETANMNDGVPVNSISYVDGYYGKGMHTDSAYSAVNVGNHTSLQITGDLAISMWIFPEDDSCGTFLISKAPSDYGEYTLVFSTAICDNYIALFRSGYSSSTLGYPPTSAWTLVTFTTNSTDAYLYFNETLMYHGSGIVADTSSSIPVYIGNLPAETAYGHNVIYDEVRIYNRTLSQDDVTELFENPTPTTTTTIGSSGISGTSCLNNNTLRTSTYTQLIQANSTLNETLNSTQIEDTYCEQGCVQTGNMTAECRPTPLNTTLILLGAVFVFFLLIAIILRQLRVI